MSKWKLDIILEEENKSCTFVSLPTPFPMLSVKITIRSKIYLGCDMRKPFCIAWEEWSIFKTWVLSFKMSTKYTAHFNVMIHNCLEKQPQMKEEKKKRREKKKERKQHSEHVCQRNWSILFQAFTSLKRETLRLAMTGFTAQKKCIQIFGSAKSRLFTILQKCVHDFLDNLFYTQLQIPQW